MSISSSNDVFGAKTFQIVVCPHCRLHFRFYRRVHHISTSADLKVIALNAQGVVLL
jgi:hypothetical protein